METRRTRPTSEEEAQRAVKQQKVSHVPNRGAKRTDIQPPEHQAWLPAPMLGGEPLMDDASIRDFNGGHWIPRRLDSRANSAASQRYG